ncbi:putative glycoside hydrolase [Pontiellaceae bacterium B12219]|nr:putative glycoside hydrolase [Pontiellaceae bacterium B12219]
MPEFSWDTVPRYMHVRKVTAFTPEEIDYLATFPLITFEKTTGQNDFGSTEAGTEKAAKAVKKVNSDAKILYYRNIIVHYPCYYADEKLAEIQGAFLADKNGNENLVRNRVRAYDLSNKKVQQWWLDNAKWVCSSKSIDGVFVDGNIKALEPGYLSRQIGEEKKAETMEGYHVMMKKLPQVIGKNELVVANVIRARFDDAGLEFVDYFDGSYIEGFEHAVGGVSQPDYVAKGIAAVQQAAQSGKIIAFTIGAGKYADTDMDEGKSRSENINKSSLEERFTYALALFLICAEKYSYFLFTDGYGVDDGNSKLWMNDMPEYSRPLGAPLGPATRNGYRYQRKFEQADVSVDIENKTAGIIWKQL